MRGSSPILWPAEIPKPPSFLAGPWAFPALPLPHCMSNKPSHGPWVIRSLQVWIKFVCEREHPPSVEWPHDRLPSWLNCHHTHVGDSTNLLCPWSPGLNSCNFCLLFTRKPRWKNLNVSWITLLFRICGAFIQHKSQSHPWITRFSEISFMASPWVVCVYLSVGLCDVCLSVCRSLCLSVWYVCVCSCVWCLCPFVYMCVVCVCLCVYGICVCV